MPNLRGRTLDKAGDGQDGRATTSVLKGRISIVCVMSKTWAEYQVKSWVGEKENPEIQKLVKESEGMAQIMELNVEEGRLYRAVLKLFEGRLRRMRRKTDWEKYFFLTGIPDSVRECTGIIQNSKAGYVYLVDAECRIRWAGSGDAEQGEKEALVKGFKKLIEEKKTAFQGADIGTKGTSKVQKPLKVV